MIYFYLYIIPCIINALYVSIPVVFREYVKSTRVVMGFNPEYLRYSETFLIRLAIATVIVCSWWHTIKVICYEINIILYKFYSKQPYLKARIQYYNSKVQDVKDKHGI